MAVKRKTGGSKGGTSAKTGAAARSAAASKAAKAESVEAKRTKGRKGGLKTAANARKRSAAARKAAATRNAPTTAEDVGAGAVIGAAVAALAGGVKHLLTGGKSESTSKRKT